MDYNENESTPLVPTKYKSLKFRSCVSCGACGDECVFSHHRVTFVVDSDYHRIVGVKTDAKTTTCNGECLKPCVTNFSLVV